MSGRNRTPSAIGGGPTFRSGPTVGRGTPSDPFRAAPRTPSRGGGGGRRSSRVVGRAPIDSEVPSERQLEAIERAGGDRADFIPAPSVSFVRGGRTTLVGVSPAAAELIARRQAEGGFERVAREDRAFAVQRAAESTGLGGVSAERGAQLVTPRGDTVGAVSTESGARLVTQRGEFIEMERTPQRSFVVSEAPRRGATERLFDSLARRAGGGAVERRAASSFGAGLSTGFSQPVSSATELFGGRSGVVQRGSGFAPDSSFLLGQGLGVAANVPAGRALGLAFVGVGSGARRVAGRFGLSQTQAGRAGLGAAVVGGGALVGSSVLSASRVDDPRARAFAFADVGGQIALQGSGAFTASRSSVARARSVGSDVGGFVDEAVPRFGTMPRSSVTDPFRAASQQVSGALGRRPSTPRIDAESVSVVAGAPAFSRVTSPTRSGRFFSDSTIGIPVARDVGRGVAFQTTLTFGRGQRAVPRVTPEASSNIIRGGAREDPLSVSLTEFARLRRDSQTQRVFGSRDVSAWDESLALGRGSRSLRDFMISDSPSPSVVARRASLFGSRRGQLQFAPQQFRPVLPSPPSISSLRLPSRGRRIAPERPSDLVPLGGRRVGSRSRSRSGFGFFPAVSSGFSQGLITNNIVGSRFGSGFDSSFDAVPRFDSRSALRSDVSFAPAQQTVQTSSLGFGGGFFPGIPRPPRRGSAPRSPAPPRAPPFGGLNFGLPGFGLSGTRSSPPDSRTRRESFTPSLVAQFLDIRTSSRPTRRSTGLEIRPLFN